LNRLIGSYLAQEGAICRIVDASSSKLSGVDDQAVRRWSNRQAIIQHRLPRPNTRQVALNANKDVGDHTPAS
jgi:hypothetical protein